MKKKIFAIDSELDKIIKQKAKWLGIKSHKLIEAILIEAAVKFSDEEIAAAVPKRVRRSVTLPHSEGLARAIKTHGLTKGIEALLRLGVGGGDA